MYNKLKIHSTQSADLFLPQLHLLTWFQDAASEIIYFKDDQFLMCHFGLSPFLL